MSDNTQRRDAWRNANTAGTVTGAPVHDRKPDREHESEAPHLSDTHDLSTGSTTDEDFTVISPIAQGLADARALETGDGTD
jgi:hypothetical protein